MKPFAWCAYERAARHGSAALAYVNHGCRASAEGRREDRSPARRTEDSTRIFLPRSGRRGKYSHTCLSFSAP